MRRISGLVTALFLAASLLSAVPVAPARGAGDPIAAFALTSPRAFTPDGDGRDDLVAAAVQTTAEAILTADVLTWEGSPVTTVLVPTDLAAGTYGITWDGAGAANGPYRLRVSATLPAGGPTTTRELQVARVPALIGGTNPGGLVVFLDPGHGGDGNGGAEARLPDGTEIRERDLNLDIALKLASMLRAAGVRVSMSRTADVPANASRTDRNADHTINLRDDWLARMDAANKVRADLYLAIHNNAIPSSPTIDAYGHGRTEAFFCGAGCTGSAKSRALASAVLQAHVDALSPLQTADWHLTIGDPRLPPADQAPTDDAVHFKEATYPPGRHYYYLGQYAPPFRPRALQMPAMLMESLALTDPHELAMLAEPSIRTLIASAYYDGIARYLAGRTAGLRLDPVASPATARVGRTTTVAVRVTNNGNRALPAGTGLTVGTLKPVPVYDGSASPGTTIGTARLAARLEPGASVVVKIPVRPRAAGAAIWKVDAVLSGVRTSTQRVPFLQLRVRVTR